MKHLYLIVGILVLANTVFSQQVQVIETKDGEKIEGYLIERKINDYILLKTFSNDTIKIPFNSIKSIYNYNIQENSPQKSKADKNIDFDELRYKNGFRLLLVAGGNNSYYTLNPMIFNLEFLNTFKINNYLDAGIGMGLNIAKLSSFSFSGIVSSDLNFKGNIRPHLEISNGIFSPFVFSPPSSYKLGYSIDGVMGFKIQNVNKAPIIIGVNYRHQRYHYQEEYFNGELKGVAMINRIGFSASLFFNR